jgi:alkylated DNA nucleotide flippase Atl1
MAEGNHNIADLVEKVYTITRSIPVGRVTTYGKLTIALHLALPYPVNVDGTRQHKSVPGRAHQPSPR